MAQTETVKNRKSNKPASKSRQNAIGQFFIDKIDGDVMRKYIAEKKLDIETDDVTDEQLGVALFSHFDATIEDDDQKVQCDNCKGISSEDDDHCPYCGDEGEVENQVEVEASDDDEEEASNDSDDDEDEEEEKPSVKKSAKKSDDEDEEEEESDEDDSDEDEEEEKPSVKKSAKKSDDEDEDDSDDDSDDEDSDEDDSDEEEDEEEEKPSVKKSSKKDDEEEDEEDDDSDEEEESDDEEDEEEAAAAAPAPRKRGRPKGSKNKESKMATTEHVNGVSKKKDALVKTVKGDLTTKDLDKAVAEVVRLKSEGAENYWRLGQKLFEINKKQLWKLRLKDDGKTPKYRGFEAFVQAELNMSSQHAYNAIDVASNYDSPEEVRELGHTKAALLLKAAPEDREKLKAKAKKGATKRQLEADVKKSREKSGHSKGGKKAEAGKKGGEARAKKAAATAEKVSIAAIEGSKTIKLYKKPESMRGFDPKNAVRATSLKDSPFGFFELVNGVMQYYSIFLKDGALVMKIQTHRQASEDSEE